MLLSTLVASYTLASGIKSLVHFRSLLSRGDTIYSHDIESGTRPSRIVVENKINMALKYGFRKRLPMTFTLIGVWVLVESMEFRDDIFRV